MSSSHNASTSNTSSQNMMLQIAKASADARLDFLRTQRNEALDRVATLEGEKAGLTKAIVSMQDTVSNLEAKIADMSTATQVHLGKLLETNEELESLRAKNANLEAEVLRLVEVRATQAKVKIAPASRKAAATK